MEPSKIERKYQEFLLEIPNLLTVQELIDMRSAYYSGAEAVYLLMMEMAHNEEATDAEGKEFLDSMAAEIKLNLKGKHDES